MKYYRKKMKNEVKSVVNGIMWPTFRILGPLLYLDNGWS